MPRSPSRDLSDRYVGKRGYFRNPDAIRRGKYALAAVAFLAAAGWAAVDVLRPAQAAYAHTHGPLAGPHAAFDDNCAACHVSHSPGEFGPLAVLNTRDRWHDLSCGKCHAGPDDPGFAHHASATAAAKDFHKRCSNCHHDHLGRLNSLVRLSDADCTHCHNNLSQWHDASLSKTKSRNEQPYHNAITDFATNHPDFRSLDPATKPRTLKFSHAVHMNPGQAYAPGGKEAMTLARVRALSGPAAAERYRTPGQADDALVTLDCASCHKLDAGTGTAAFDNLKAALDKFGEPSQTLLPPRADGAYFLPVTFEANCRSCHPLAAPDGVVAAGDKKLAVAGFAVPHRRQPAELLSDLKAGYVKEMIAADHPALAAPPEPGGKLDPPPALTARTLGDEAGRLAQVAGRQLFAGSAGCAKCHTVTGSGEALRVAPVPDHTVWFTHAKFNHAAHRGTTCASCHPGTGGAAISPVDAEKPEPVRIRGVESCRACHSPAGTKVTFPDGTTVTGGGVRHDCTECHRYHHGDLPVQGRGAASRYPKNPRDLADWLKGQ